MIGWDRVNELCDEVGPEDFLEVVDIFLEEVDEVIERLDTSPNPACYEADLHFLKGSALNLGFDGLATLCANGEKSARDNDVQAVRIKPVIENVPRFKVGFPSRA